jgi:hypothetical protein
MSGYTYTQTPLIDESAIRAMPRTGREEALGFGGNTSYFSKAPQEDVDEAQREGKPFYLVRYFHGLSTGCYVIVSLMCCVVGQAYFSRRGGFPCSRSLAF